MNRNADLILDESFLDVRAKLLEVAATLDRIDRAAQDHAGLSADQKDRRGQIDAAIEICASSDGADRAARLQHLFSRPFQSDWRSTMQL
ncbi:hypothetical protein K227x_50200 [Rubripirellula lacrimiformis]|uniref:Uncharacterized protein n=1 Tax=Rubripirellula lacrimiformis TaxID=1930273 RepID=A0A517NHJ7_9BACT|nr:hypothetical protein [Rubripirellula lacrimiformis]QDT06609.1 hypothetical protein K227x_50200 [Rubripirellula lacrimiformis]